MQYTIKIIKEINNKGKVIYIGVTIQTLLYNNMVVCFITWVKQPPRKPG